MKVDKKVTIEADTDASLRETHYAVVSYDPEGKEVQGFVFSVTDTGEIQRLSRPQNLIGGVDITFGYWDNSDRG